MAQPPERPSFLVTDCENMSEKEREKKVIQNALDGSKAFADISAEERFYNRSVRIRRKVMQWLMENLDESFDSYGDMEARCANFAGCSMPTARRWIYQWTRPGKPFQIQEGTDFYIVRARPAQGDE